LTDEGSNILVYMTGHGGDGFLKFQVILSVHKTNKTFHSIAIWVAKLLGDGWLG
jgi:glycosylphosphatidylinositol transamidase (GPIT) subunit GPI8